MSKKKELPRPSIEEIKKQRQALKDEVLLSLWNTDFFKKVQEDCNKKREGKPYIITPLILSELYYIYIADVTDEEACAYAGISTTALYEFQKRYPEFTELKQAWKRNVVYKAKMTVKNYIHTPAMAQWLLERHPDSRKSYSLTQNIEGKFTLDTSTPKKEKLLERLKSYVINRSGLELTAEPIVDPPINSRK